MYEDLKLFNLFKSKSIARYSGTHMYVLESEHGFKNPQRRSSYVYAMRCDGKPFDGGNLVSDQGLNEKFTIIKACMIVAKSRG